MPVSINSGQSGRILVVDDTTANLQLLTNLLTEQGYTVHPASDGELALKFVRETLPDLILLDIRMPGMDGFEVCRRLKADERTRTIPLIFISILEDERDKVLGFSAGAVDYITKPFQPEEVLARIQTHLQLRELTERLEQKVAERTSELTIANQLLQQEVAERRRAEEAIQKIEWMLSRKAASFGSDQAGDQVYGDLTRLNRGGLISSSIDKDVLRGIASEYMDMLNTSSAIYEKNGDYAFGIFSSSWCRLMDSASRKLCPTDDNATALASGKWLCHESCWTNCSRPAIDRGAPVDIECNGGIRLYSVPIFAGEEIIGAINFGYGDPPCEPEKLRALADTYALDYGNLAREARAYDTRPPFIIDMAKRRLQVSARLIGILVERKRAEEALSRLNEDLEHRVRERTARLQVSNKELQGFCYTVSHDLRAPLRHLDGYVELLVSSCRARLSDKDLHYFDSIAASARQMGELIDDLLQFSRTGSAELHLGKVDMNRVLQVALAPVLKECAERAIDWVIGELPQVRGDSTLLRQVWANLLGNAVKFTRTRENARIEIGSREEMGEIIFSVTDNGVGFEMQYAGKLFGVFQRLHPLAEFEGTGIGLATVQRIIARHGGRVWAEAEPERGASFYFTLPTYCGVNDRELHS